MRATLSLVVTAAAVVAGCGAGDLTADSTCRDYVHASRDAQQRAVQVVAQDNRRAYSVLVQNNVDARCSVAPDKTVKWAITGENDGGSASAAKTDEPEATDTSSDPTQGSETGEQSNAPRTDHVIPTKSEQRRLQEQNPCVREGVCGDAAFIACSDNIDAQLWQKCKELGIPYDCGCYHGMAGDKPGYWAKRD
jgi:hypothetical protein